LEESTEPILERKDWCIKNCINASPVYDQFFLSFM